MNDTEKIEAIKKALDEMEKTRDKVTGRIEQFEQMVTLGEIKEIMKK